VPGAPFESSPQRHNHSLNPVNHPSPPRSSTLTNAGLTGCATGDFHPNSSPSHVPFHNPIPRVGRIETDNRPLFSSTTSTPSDSPPRSDDLLTDHLSEPASVTPLRGESENFSTQVFVAASVKT